MGIGAVYRFRAQMDAGVWAKPWNRAMTVRAQEPERGRGNGSNNMTAHVWGP